MYGKYKFVKLLGRSISCTEIKIQHELKKYHACQNIDNINQNNDIVIMSNIAFYILDLEKKLDIISI